MDNNTETREAESTSSFELRPSVRVFAEAMEERLRENDDKGGWGKNECSIEYLERRLIEEFAEYLGEKSCETGNSPAWEAVDMGNFAMMLFHRHNGTGKRLER